MTIMAVDPQSYARIMSLKFTKNTPPGALQKLEEVGSIILTAPVAASLNVTVNDVILTNTIKWVRNPKNPFFPIPVRIWQNFTVIGIADAAFLELMQFGSFSLAKTSYVSYATFDTTYEDELPMLVGKSNLIYADAKIADTEYVKSRILEMSGSNEFNIITFGDILNLVKPSLNIVFLIFDIMQWFVFIITAIAILLVMWMSINERIPELGMMIAVGTSKSQIIMIVFGEACLYGLFGFVASVPMSISFHRVAVGVMSAMGFSTTFTLPGLVEFSTPFLLSIVTSLSGSTYPSWKAANLDVIQAVKYTE